MQRTSAGFYQPLMNRSEDFLTISQVHNTTSVGSFAQPHHWKKKVLNKAATNKRRQNPARQAAVRSFKKYQFSNQDFLLRKYLRSIKKELRPKQCETIVPTTSNAVSVSGRQLVENCARRVPNVNDLRCKISNPTNIMTSTVSSLNNKKHSNNQEIEAVSKINKYQEFNSDQEIKLCPKRKWPTRGFERPTLENVQIDSASVTFHDDELKKILSESGIFISDYCKSLRDLSDIINYSDYYYPVDDSLLCNNVIYPEVINKCDKKINQSANRFFRNVRCEDKIESSNESCIDDYSYDDDGRNDYKYGWSSTNNGNSKPNIYKAAKLPNDDFEDNSEDDVDEEEEEDEEDDEDNDADDDDDDDEEDCGENSVEENNQCDGIKVSDKRSVRDSSELIRIYKNDKKSNNDNKNNLTKDVVLSIDSTDSSSVSSSLDNTSLSTETCTDDQTINSDNQDLCDFKNKINNSPIQCDDELEMIEIINPDYDTHNQHCYIKIKNEDDQVSVLDDNPMFDGSLKETQPNTLSEHVVKCNQNEQSSVTIHDDGEKIFRTNKSEQKIQSKDRKFDTSLVTNDTPKRYIKIRNRKHLILDKNAASTEHLKETKPINLPESIAETAITQTSVQSNSHSQKILHKHKKFKTTSSISETQESPHYIKIRNREYPLSILDNNPTLIEYLKDTELHTVPENLKINNRESLPTVQNYTGTGGRTCDERNSERNIEHSILDKNPTSIEYLKETQPTKLPESVVETTTTQTSVQSDSHSQKMLYKYKKSKTTSSVSDTQKSPHYIKIRNREYPLSILDNNPTLIEYLKKTEPHTLPENLEKNNEESLTSVENNAGGNTSIERNKSDAKIQSVGKINKTLYNDKINLRTNQPLKHCTSSEKIHSTEENKRVRRTFSLEKEKGYKKHDMLSSICSLEDGLAFLDNQNELPKTTNIHHLSSGMIQDSETITLYNQSTSCTLPYPASSAQEVSKNHQIKKSSKHHQNFSRDRPLPNSVASQADLSFIKGRHSSHHGSQFQCPQCKLANSNLKQSLKNSFVHLNDLITSSIVLNSLIIGKSMSDNATNLLSGLNNF